MDCTNVIEVYGIVIKPIYLTLIMTIATVLTCGSVIRGVVSWYRSRGNRQMDLYVHSANEISNVDEQGFRTLSIRHDGNVDLLDTRIQGANVRKWLIAAAMQCDWTHRFIKHPDPMCQWAILRAVRNAVIEDYKDGEGALKAKLPVVRMELYISPTGSDTEDEGVRMIRVVIATKEMLEIVHAHPPKMWRFDADGEERRLRVRLDTLRKMAEALFEHDGCRLGKEFTYVPIIAKAKVCVRI